MSMTHQTILASRPAAMVLALTLVAGLSAPFVMLPPVRAAAIVPAGTTELSAAPVEQTQAVPPNIAMTFDNSGSMASAFLGDDRPFDNGGWGSQWRCAGVINPSATAGTIGAHAMNGVYYNPNVTYYPPVYADGTSFPQAGTAGGTKVFSLTRVENDGVTAYRPLNASGSTSTTDFTNQSISGTTYYWQCYSDPDYKGNTYSGNLGQNGNHYGALRVTGGSGGPYYYQLKASALTTLQGQVDAYGNPTSAGLITLYTANNWEAVAVPSSQYQNWANWWAYYRTRNQMARTAISRAFGSPNLSAKTADGGYGGSFRVAWQNLYTSDTFTLQASTIISALMDAAGCSASSTTTSSPNVALQTGTYTTPPPCYRSAFFNWVFSVPATGNTPSRAATIRAGQFFTRGNGNTGATGDLHDPYWQPPQTGTFNAVSNPGNELYCRQNFHMLVTDGYSNESDPSLPSAANNAGVAFKDVVNNYTLPDGVAFSSTAAVSQIFWNNRGSDYPSTMANIAFNYWATDLRPDLYQGGAGAPKTGNIVAPYLPDTYTGLFTGAGNVTGGNGNAQNIPAEEYFNPKNDPATWPHLVQYMVTLGVSGILNHSNDTDCKTYTAASPNDGCALRTGKTVSDGNTGWPRLVNNSPQGIDDIWHATVNSRGSYFNAGNPQDLVDQLSAILSNISERAAAPKPAAVNASVATVGSLSFKVGHGSNWSGVFQAVVLNQDGTVGTTPVWDANTSLDAMAVSLRNIYTVAYSGSSLNPFAFTAANATSLDATETAGLGPASNSGNDTQANRINYLRGDLTHETDGTYRSRKDPLSGVEDLLGAIIHSDPVYVSFPNSGYNNNWPSGSSEAVAAAASNGTDDKSYDSFQTDHASRPGTVYVGANDGMLHAFAAPAPTGCAANGTGCNYGNGGTERWAFIPRAVYANLGNLTSITNFQFRPTVDGTPVTRDVFFSENSRSEWHTILAGGVGVGGRGVYALDITDPTAFTATNVLWEFDSDMTIPTTCVSIMGSSSSGTCQASDLGYTVSQPNIGRLATGKWVVIAPNGYFPDCSQPDVPTPDKTSCAAIAAQAPKDTSGNPYSALFVLDAQTGSVIAELKTPTNISGVTSFGLATPVMGDYNNDQVDDVAFAGDLQGNLWRFDLSDPSPSNWTVTLVYKGLADASGNQGLQPITTMPRLFPDPATNRFMVVFGTGKYLGAADNGTNTTQALMGVRDVLGTTYSQSGLTQDYLHETIAPATLPNGNPNPNAGATLRCVTGKSTDTCDTTSTTNPPTQVNAIPAPGATGGGGWFINLYTTTSTGVQNNQGERVVVSPGAIFASNTVVFETLLTGTSGSDPCNPATQGSVMAFNAVTGGPAGVSSLGGWPMVGARISNARTSGSLPLVSALGGGQVYLPGLTVAPGNNPLSIDAPIWRRRSWQEINQ